MSWGPTFVGKHRDTFRRSSSYGLPPQKPATPRPCRGRIQKSLPCRDHKRLRSSAPRHLFGSADCHRFPPQKLLRRIRYGAIRIITKTPGDDPLNCPRPQSHWLGVESSATGEPPTHNNISDAETFKTRPCFTLQRLAPPAPFPSLERKQTLPTGATVNVIVIQKRLPWPRRRISRRKDPHGRSPQGV